MRNYLNCLDAKESDPRRKIATGVSQLADLFRGFRWRFDDGVGPQNRRGHRTGIRYRAAKPSGRRFSCG